MSAETKEFILSRNYLVSSADVDFEGVIRVSSLVNFLIQTAWQHAEHLGWGVDDLLKKNLAWVLSGLKLEILQHVKWKDIISIETWPKGINRLFYMRDFLVRDSDGTIVAKATSNWLLIDIDKRRPKLIEIDDVVFKMNTERHAVNEYVPAIPLVDEPEHETRYEVRYSNIDINQHLTTTGYIDFVFDTFEPGYISQHRVKSITVNFIREVRYGTPIKMCRKSAGEQSYQFQLESADSSNNIFFRAMLIF